MAVRTHPDCGKSCPACFSTRYWGKIDKTEGCWLWRGAVNSTGYATITVAGRQMMAYRLAYEMESGAIPPGLEIDHLCKTRICLRPDHLEAVSRRVNLARSDNVIQHRANSEFCRKGHRYTIHNTDLSAGVRVCKTCRRNAHRQMYRDQVAATGRQVRKIPERNPLPTGPVLVSFGVEGDNYEMVMTEEQQSRFILGLAKFIRVARPVNQQTPTRSTHGNQD